MKQNSSRRAFLRNSAMATSGLALLSSTTTMQAFTKNNIPFDGYNPYVEFKSDLRTTILPEKEVVVKGVIYNTEGTVVLPNALVEVWHLSPNSKKYRHRGKMMTNENGEYRFITEFPNKELESLPRIYFRVSKGSKSYVTQLILAKTGAQITGKHWEENQGIKKDLLPKTSSFLNTTTVNFNITN